MKGSWNQTNSNWEVELQYFELLLKQTIKLCYFFVSVTKDFIEYMLTELIKAQNSKMTLNDH